MLRFIVFLFTHIPSKVKIAIFSTGTILALLLVYQQYFGNYLSSTASEIIYDIVEKESNGTYRLSYKYVTVNPLDKSIYIDSVRLELITKDTDLVILDSYDNSYEIFIPKLRIQLKSLSRLAFNRELQVNNLELYNPIFQVNHYPEFNKDLKFNENTGDLYSAMQGYIQSYQVENFKVQDAVLNYDIRNSTRQGSFAINDFSFRIKNFELDSTSRLDESKIFYTDEIELTLKNQVLPLTDKLHVLTFESLSISTFDSTIIFDDIRINPKKDSLLNPEIKTDLNVYNFEIPYFKLAGVDFKKAYNENKLQIASIFLRDPDLKADFLGSLTLRSENKKSTNRLSAVLSSIFGEILISDFNVQNASLNTIFYPEKSREEFTSDSIGIRLRNFQIDSMAHLKMDETVFYDDFEININNFVQVLPDSVHRVRVKNLFLSTSSKKIVANDILIEPLFSIDSLKKLFPREELYLYTIQSPRTTFSGIELKEALFENRLVIQNIEISNGNIRIFEPLFRQKKRGRQLYLLPLLKETFHEINLGSFDIVNCNVEISSIDDTDFVKHMISDFNFSLFNLKLDSAIHKNQEDIIRECNLRTNFSRGQLKLFSNSYVFNASDVKVDSKSGLVSSGQLTLNPTYIVDYQDTVFLHLEGLYMSGLSFSEAIIDENYEADSIHLISPRLKIMGWKPAETDNERKRSSLDIRTISFEDGEIDFSSGENTNVNIINLDGHAYDFQFNHRLSTRLINLGQILVTGDDLNVREPTFGNLSLSSLEINSYRNSLTLRNIDFRPGGQASKNNNSSIRIPEFSVSGLKFGSLINDKDLIAQTNI
jgi:hypothetical protein